VIDPHLKWLLRSKLKELHRELKRTMIYVTHDQTEALTFADRVVVMNLGEVVQIGTPVELFESPKHTFVGRFIGSPGMNILPCRLDDGHPTIDGQPIVTANGAAVRDAGGVLEIGARPEFVSFADDGLAVDVVRVSDAGRYRVVDTRSGDHSIKMLVDEGADVPGGAAHLRFDPEKTRVYRDGWVVT
jgi:glycerol transport system ATP-binding protein